MDFRDALRYIRLKKGFTQANLCNGIMSQSSYSKIETKDSSLPTELMAQLSRQLNAVPSDLDEIILKNAIYYVPIMTLIKIQLGMIPTEKILDVFPIIEKYKMEHSYVYRSYIICKTNFHKLYPHSIPDLSKKEKESIINNILKTDHHTYYDILNMAECVTYYSTEKLIEVIEKILPFSFECVHTPNRLRTISLPILLVNIAEQLIDDEQYHIATSILDNLDYLLQYNENYRFSILSQYSRHKIFIFTNSNKHMRRKLYKEISFLIYILKKTFNNYPLADAINKEFSQIRKTNKPLKQVILVLES